MGTGSYTSAQRIGRTFWTKPSPGQNVFNETTQWFDGSIGGGAGHYGYPDFPPIGNVGGSVDIRNSTCQRGVTGVGTLQYGNDTDYRYEGGMVSWYSRLGVSSPYSPSSWGAAAYAKTKPTKPQFQALNAVYELREVPGMLRQRFLQSGLAGIGDYYLALRFGWIPLLNDVRNLVSTQRNMEKHLKQLLRDNGRPVRRRVTLANVVSTPTFASGVAYSGLSPVLQAPFYKRAGLWTQKDYISDRVWAAAKMRFWLPPGPRDINWTRSMMAKLYGLHPSPSVIYNMIPWSWLVDWFTNTGSLIENMDVGVADRLAYDYCYVMRQVETIRETTGRNFYNAYGGTELDVSAQAISVSASKQRMPGDPFGWNTNEASLNGVQLSILGALGLSRLR